MGIGPMKSMPKPLASPSPRPMEKTLTKMIRNPATIARRPAAKRMEEMLNPFT